MYAHSMIYIRYVLFMLYFDICMSSQHHISVSKTAVIFFFTAGALKVHPKYRRNCRAYISSHDYSYVQRNKMNSDQYIHVTCCFFFFFMSSFVVDPGSVCTSNVILVLPVCLRPTQIAPRFNVTWMSTRPTLTHGCWKQWDFFADDSFQVALRNARFLASNLKKTYKKFNLNKGECS